MLFRSRPSTEKGYDPVLGARPLRRAIQREIEDSLSEKILFGEIRAGQLILVDAVGEGLLGEFTFRGVPKGDSVLEPVTVAATVPGTDLPPAPPSSTSSDTQTMPISD